MICCAINGEQTKHGTIANRPSLSISCYLASGMNHIICCTSFLEAGEQNSVVVITPIWDNHVSMIVVSSEIVQCFRLYNP